MRLSDVKVGQGYYRFGDMISVVFVISVDSMVTRVVNAYEIRNDDDLAHALEAEKNEVSVIAETTQGKWELMIYDRMVDHTDLCEIDGLRITDSSITEIFRINLEDVREGLAAWRRGEVL